MTGLDDEPALDAAEAAVLAGLVIEDDRAAGRYRFAHALVRETIYEDISRARRARLHARVADALVAVRGAEPEPAAEMAYHCWQAAPVIGADRALPHLLRAGEQAAAQLAYETADEQFDRALQLAGQLPAGPQATDQEIHIAARLGTVRLVMRGYADPDAAAALARARSLAVRAGRRGEPADGRWALFMSRLLRSELGPAQELGAELVALGTERNDPALLSAGHWQVGTVALYRGDLQDAQHHLEHALAASRDIAPGAPCDAPVELTLLCQGALGVARAYQGHADAALRLTRQAVGSARRLGDPLSLVFALFVDAWAATIAEEVTRVLDSATEQAALIGKHGFRQWGIAPPFLRGGPRPAAAIRAAASSGSGPHWPRWTRREPQGTARSRSDCWPRPSCWPAVLPRPATRCAWPPRRRTGWASTCTTRSCAPCKPGSGKPIPATPARAGRTKAADGLMSAPPGWRA